MPNHCESDLFIHGPNAIIDEVIKKHFTPEGALNCTTVIPYPATYKELDDAVRKWEEDNKDNPNRDWRLQSKDGFNSGGYEWCCTNWGTKWGTYGGSGINKTTRGLSTGFQSAWSPPTPVVTALAAMYPKLKIQMNSFERGAGYQVKANWENGELVSEDQSGYRGSRGG
jgi:hypothetical protein